MPELPEVETVVRGLRESVVGQTIRRVKVNAPASSIFISPSIGSSTLSDSLRRREILGVVRRGKNILISLSGEVTLWVHLKMTGRFFYLPAKAPIDRHDLVIFEFGTDNGSRRQLRFNDYRRFGRLRLFHDSELWQQPGLRELGPEPLTMSADKFVNLCRGGSRMIKPALLDQSFIAGLGNIYADESLYSARIHPRRLTGSLSCRKLVELHGHIKRLLRKAIRLMGSSVDTYAGVNGQRGRFQSYLRAYDHEGLPCSFCGRAIVREKVGSRSAHYCPRCQRSPRLP